MSLKQFTVRDYGEGRSAQQIAKYFKDNGLVSHTTEYRPRLAGKKHRVRPFPTREGIQQYLVSRGYDVLEWDSEQSSDVEDDTDF
jgi:hypothetical protein